APSRRREGRPDERPQRFPSCRFRSLLVSFVPCGTFTKSLWRYDTPRPRTLPTRFDEPGLARGAGARRARRPPLPSYTAVAPRDPSYVRSIWPAVIAESHDSDSYGLYVLTPAAVHWAVFGEEERHQAALEAVRDGADPRAALGRDAASVPLDD